MPSVLGSWHFFFISLQALYPIPSLVYFLSLQQIPEGRKLSFSSWFQRHSARLVGCAALSLQQGRVHHGVCVIMEATYLEAVWQQRIRLSPGFPNSLPCFPTSDLSPPVRTYLLIRPLLSVPSNHESLKWITLDKGRTTQILSLPKSLSSEHNAFAAKLSEGHSYLYQPALCSTLATSTLSEDG